MTAQSAIPSALEARSLYRFYRAGDAEPVALQAVSLRLERGEFVAVTGTSGPGKSTLLACLAGMDKPDGGSVRIAARFSTSRNSPRPAVQPRLPPIPSAPAIPIPAGGHRSIHSGRRRRERVAYPSPVCLNRKPQCASITLRNTTAQRSSRRHAIASTHAIHPS